MKLDAKIYHFYTNVIAHTLRVVIFLLLFSLSLFGFVYHLYPNFFITAFCLFLIFEIYFTQKIAKQMPKQTVSEVKDDILVSFSLAALGAFETCKDSKTLVQNLISYPQVKFILQKLDISESEILLLEIDKTQIANNAFNIAKIQNGKYVTTTDLFAAYLLLTEPQTKLLFGKELNVKDLEEVLLWAANTYPFEEIEHTRSGLAGEGLAESWVYGWTLETRKYMIDLTNEFLADDKEPVGRQNEYAQIAEALHKNQSVILVGEAGSGKESVVRRLAMDSYYGQLKDSLYHQKIFQLMVDEFMAGAQTQGEIEGRLSALMTELEHSGNVIVYIPEFQNLLGSESFHLDISGAIIPYLKNGNVRIIAAVTPGAYKKFVEPLSSMLDVFRVINFVSLSKEQVLDLLFVKALDIETRNAISISYKALVSAIEFADKYAKDKIMPGSVVDLLEDSANAARLSGKKILEKQDVLDQVKKKIYVEVGEPKALEKNLLLNLESQLHKRIIAQDEAISAISQALRRLREGLGSLDKPISFLFLGPTGVGKTETAKALADIYFKSKERFLRFDMSEFVGEDGIRKFLGGVNEDGVLTEAVFDNPYSLILLDEFEKTDKKIQDLFLQVFDDGRLTDGRGKTVNFADSIIIATSNAGSEYIRESVEKNINLDKNFQQTLLEFLQTKGLFSPELLNRFDGIIVFKPLEKQDVVEIVKLLLLEFSKTLSQKDIRISFDQKIIEKIALDGFNKDFGARPIRRYIQDNIEDSISRQLLRDEIKRGDNILISLDNTQNIIASKI